MSANENRFCIHGRFWTTIPAREHTTEELAALRELIEIEEEENAVE